MSISPRTLRPSSAFTPKSISGLALWLDASSTGDLYTTDAGPVTAVSLPTEISGCVLWLDGADSSAASMTLNGSLVETWKDKSGGGNNATATGTARPTLTGGGLNGKSVVTFDGSANAMQITASAAFNTNDVTYIVVFKQAAAANKGVYTKLNASAGTNGFGLAVRSDPQIWLLQKNAGAAQVLTSSANPTTQARIYSVTSSSSATGYLDGLSSATSASTADHSLVQRVMVGSRDSSEYLNGYIAEVIHYNRVLTRSELAQVEALLAAKWGISGVHAQATATSDPVGYWRDRSGNNRHATQATAGNRPAVSATTQGGRKALAFDTQTKTVISPASVAQYVADATTSPKMFFAWVARPEGSATGICWGSPTHPNAASRVFYASDFGVTGGHIVDFGSVSTARLTGTVGDETNNVGHVYSAFRDGAIMSVRRDGVEIIRKTNASGAYTDTTGTLAINTTAGGSATASWMEFLAVANAPSASRIAQIERYLATKWGITLAPQVSNADAQDWINRVYANGGTVSASTASAVNAFCDAIDYGVNGASIRDRFYRLNLFAGTLASSIQSSGVVVPLYRNWSGWSGRNLLSTGDNLTTSAWTKSASTASASASERPFAYGPFAYAATANAGSGVTPYVVNTSNNYGYGTVTVSAYLKANGINSARILLSGSSGMTFPGGGSVAYATVNLTTGAVSSVLTGATATATDVGNGWWRFALTVANNSTGNMAVRIDIGSGSSYTATGSESILVWGIQSEVASTASAYEPYPVGNTTDTSNAFATTNYNETGPSGGLQGNGTSTYLNTGLTTAALPQLTTGHLSAYAMTGFSAASAYGLVTSFNTGFDGSNFYGMEANAGNASGVLSGAWGGAFVGRAQAAAGIGLVSASRTTNTELRLYRNGSQIGSTLATTVVPAANGGGGFAVFASMAASGSVLAHAPIRMGGYSIGAGLDASQSAAYYTAMQTFQAALLRSV